MITIEQMHPDLLFETADRKLIHLELHGYWMDDFAVRNLLYFAFILRDHKRAPEQIVLWIGKHKPGVPDGLSLAPKLVYSYRVIDVRTLDAEPLLASGGIDEAIFAVLCRNNDKRGTVLRILRRIIDLPVAKQRDALLQLLVLSGLRGLTPMVRREAKSMPVSIDIHENEFLEEVYQGGKKEGLRTAREMLLNLLEQKFGPVPAPTKRRVGKADSSDILTWSQRVLKASTLDEVLR